MLGGLRECVSVLTDQLDGGAFGFRDFFVHRGGKVTPNGMVLNPPFDVTVCWYLSLAKEKRCDDPTITG